jgi:dipeptidyl aminopeptidase/acylaminoacyl peptidase
MKFVVTILAVICANSLIAQINPNKTINAYDSLFATNVPLAKKVPITHAVYDHWESLGERIISNNGAYVAYAVNVQEGDSKVLLSNTEGKLLTKIPRAYNITFSNNNQFLIGKIKPFFKDTRDAKIKKKRPDDMPKDSLFIYAINTDSLIKIPRVKSYKMPEKEGNWLAYLLEKVSPTTAVKPIKPVLDSTTQINSILRMADSLRMVADSLVAKTKEAKASGLSVLNPTKTAPKPATPTKTDDPIEEGTDLVYFDLTNQKQQKLPLVAEYYFDKFGKKLLVETTKKNTDTITKAMVLWITLANQKKDTVFVGFNDAKNYAISENANQLAFVIEKDSSAKALQKFYKLIYVNEYKTATIIAEKASTTIQKGLTPSPDFNNAFSKDGSKLYFGLAPIRKPKDTSLVEFETARLDVWHHNDDYLQPQQLLQANAELRKSYLSVYHTLKGNLVQLGNDTLDALSLINEGNADYVVANSSYGNRKQLQWVGSPLYSAYTVNSQTGATTTIYKNALQNANASPNGNFLFWYNPQIKHWFTYHVATGKTINATTKIKVPLFDEEDDHPDLPPPHGFMRWAQNDSVFYVYDKYDIWACDPLGTTAPICLTNGRANKVTTRWQNTDPDDRFILPNKSYWFNLFNNENKNTGTYLSTLASPKTNLEATSMTTVFSRLIRAKNNVHAFTYQCESSTKAPWIVSNITNIGTANGIQILYESNPQQNNYIWYTNQLVKWKMFDGKQSEGILYKPENFDATKKYPIIFYFYERDADDLNNYRAPAPSASTINIPYFTSNGYLVFDPNIYYKNGEPGQSAYNSIVSAAKYLAKTYSFVDSTKMAIQGQSWGGYQVAHLVTRTNIFAAAGAGAPVANMTSAYGGIRWGSGLNRQFQYEKSQSRIGATLWQNRELYIKNSPLFFADKVKTPLLIMHNDKDGAVPWYQGIEYFTALRRLGKTVYMLQYNDEDHNLIERRNRKDLSIRLAQFFDHYLKGKPMPKWMKTGVPATDKGIDWGTGE